MKRLLSFLAASLLTSSAGAAPTINGVLELDYGGPLAVQSVETDFGDSSGGLTSGGELDAGYAVIDGGRLYVMLTGNIENNFNKVSVFVDSVPGGENILTNVPQYDFNNVSQNFGGLTFDAGFTADYHLFGRWGGSNGNTFEVDIANRAGGGSASVGVNGAAASLGAGMPIQVGVINPGNNGMNNLGNRTLAGFLTNPVNFGFNNNNSGGVDACNTPAMSGCQAANVPAALAVTTGFEFAIALADLGNPSAGSQIKIHAVYGNGDNNYHSNQTLAGLPAGTIRLGGDGTGGFTGTLSGVNFNNFAGNQFFTIQVPVPEPTSLLLMAMALATLIGRRCRRT
jgi:PEP-CTERM motif